MWQYQNTDEMYVGRFDSDDYIQHGKYLRKYVGKSGKMVYIYPKKNNEKGKLKVESKMGYNDGKGTYQHYTEIYNDKTKNGISLFRGSNAGDHKYAGISIGAPKSNYAYKEKTVNLGKNKKIYVHNDNGTLNIEFHSNKKKKGQNAVSKVLKKK